MTSFTKSILFILVFTITALSLFGEEDCTLRPDEKAYLTVNAKNDIDSALNSGIQSFLFEVEQQNENFELVNSSAPDEFQHKISLLAKHIESIETDTLNLLFNGSYQKDILKEFLQKVFDSHIYFFEDNRDLPSKNIQERIVCFFAEDLVSFSNTVEVGKPYQGRFSSEPDGKMVLLQTAGCCSDSLKEYCIRAWQETGRIPNFIVADNKMNIQKATEDINWLNSLRRVRGEIKFDGKLLNGIYWKQMPGSVTPGRFSFPITDYSVVLSPYKNGYLITPGEIIHHTAMKDVMRAFIAYHSNFKDGLVYHFNLDKNARNNVDIQSVNTIVNDVKWMNDNKRNQVAYFDTLNSFIDYNKPNLLNFNTPFSISVWLKPQRFSDFMGIIGVGTSFSIKLKEGYPDFTTAQIKDHIAETELKKDVWTQLGVVFNPGGTIDFFINGKKTKTMQASDIQASNQSLVIGNNIWGEQFFGYLDELMIWDRGLSEDEFFTLYQKQLNPENKSGLWFLLCIPFIVVLAFFVFRKKVKSCFTEPDKTHKKEEFAPLQDFNKKGNKIEILGNFNVVTKENGNISNQFSPLLKQLLSFFIIKTLSADENGISTKEINNTFWPGFTKEQAKDNRGTNIKKLRKLLEQLPETQIIFRDKKWFFQTGNNTTVDFYEYNRLKEQLLIEIKNGSLDKASINLFISILQRGNILQDLDYEWLDAFKGKITEEVSELLLQICNVLPEFDSLKTELAKTILRFDDLNEDALLVVVKNLSEAGNHGLARQIFEEFSKRYENLYSEPFNTDFYSLVKNKKD